MSKPQHNRRGALDPKQRRTAKKQQVYVITSSHAHKTYEVGGGHEACTDILGVASSLQGVEAILSKKARGTVLEWERGKRIARGNHKGNKIKVTRTRITKGGKRA